MPRRGENIRKRKDGRWEGRYQVGGKYKSIYGKTYKEVKDKMISSISNPNMFYEQRGPHIDFNDASTLWKSKKGKEVKSTTEFKYNYMLDTHILPIIGNLSTECITKKVMTDFVEHKRNSGKISGQGGLSESYIQTMLIIIQSVLDFIESEGYPISKSYKIPLPKQGKKHPKTLSVSQQNHFEKQLFCDPSPTNIGILLALRYGLRIGEVCALSWEDIDLENKIMYVRHTVIRNCSKGSSSLELATPKTHSSVRELPLQSDIVKFMISIKNRKLSPYVTSDHSSFISPRTFEYRFHRALDNYGIENINFHSLRHPYVKLKTKKFRDFWSKKPTFRITLSSAFVFAPSETNRARENLLLHSLFQFGCP